MCKTLIIPFWWSNNGGVAAIGHINSDMIICGLLGMIMNEYIYKNMCKTLIM